MAASRPLFAFATLLLLSSGCRDREITSYSVPKEKDPEMPGAVATPMAEASSGSAQPAMASTPVPTATGADLVWTAPARWQAQPASAMRKATYFIPSDDGATKAELS